MPLFKPLPQGSEEPSDFLDFGAGVALPEPLSQSKSAFFSDNYFCCFILQTRGQRLYRVRQANFLFHMAFHIQKRKLACRTLYIV
jgi:hypothetical protein